ncbi:MAG: hypothetical protein CMO81_10625 [Waddliaceae bacterium]|nr:hypothetical protein [Waddliaceae bacterium]
MRKFFILLLLLNPLHLFASSDILSLFNSKISIKFSLISPEGPSNEDLKFFLLSSDDLNVGTNYRLSCLSTVNSANKQMIVTPKEDGCFMSSSDGRELAFCFTSHLAPESYFFVLEDLSNDEKLYSDWFCPFAKQVQFKSGAMFYAAEILAEQHVYLARLCCLKEGINQKGTISLISNGKVMHKTPFETLGKSFISAVFPIPPGKNNYLKVSLGREKIQYSIPTQEKA